MLIQTPIYFPPAKENRTVHIYCPDDCFTSGERYPVMYYFDGHNLFLDSDATYGKSWGLAEFLPQWPKKMIVAGVECSHHGNARLREYSPYNFNTAWSGDIRGTGDETLRWIIQTVKPFMDAHYPTWSHREATGIAGSSMGGLMSLYAAVKYNAVFSKAACLSSSVHPCMPQIMDDIAKTTLHPDTRVYLSWGTEEAGGTHKNAAEDWDTFTARANCAVAEAIEQQGCTTSLYCQRGGHHCEADWEQQNELYLSFLWLEP